MIKKKHKAIDLRKLGENITKLMESCGIDASELAKQTGLPNSTISRLRTSAGENSPNLSSLLPIADFFCVSVSQLIGEDPINKLGIFRTSKAKRTPICVLNSTTILEYLDSNSSIETPYLNVDLPLSEKSFAYFLQGNAMEPQFPDNTLLIIDPTLEIENLDHVLVIPTDKRLPLFRQVLIDGDEKYLRALNPAFNEFVKLTPNSHRLLGVMIQSRRNFKDNEITSSSINYSSEQASSK